MGYQRRGMDSVGSRVTLSVEHLLGSRHLWTRPHIRGLAPTGYVSTGLGINTPSITLFVANTYLHLATERSIRNRVEFTIISKVGALV